MNDSISNSNAWMPIEPLSPKDKSIDVADFVSLVKVWEEAKKRIEEKNPQGLQAFRQRLQRQWAIETGILEKLYIVDRGTTNTLIDKGFYPDLVSRASTNIDPQRLVLMLRDHLEASDMIVEYLMKQERPLTSLFIKGLHSALTKHQEAVEAVDTLGNVVCPEPLRGHWKKQPNYRESSGGRRLSYCPPEQVEGQMEDLLTYLKREEDEGTNVCIVAAWFHSRFTYIHPFQDGNGRVARALVNYLFVRAGLFPVVIDREQKDKYIDVLEASDGGNLQPLVKFLAAKQIEAIKQALSLTDEAKPMIGLVMPSNPVKSLALAIRMREQQRREDEQIRFRGVNNLMDELSEEAKARMNEQLLEFAKELKAEVPSLHFSMDRGGSFDDRGYYYKSQVVESANKVQQWANFSEDCWWVRALVGGDSSQLRFVLSFHHVGHVLSGVAEVTAFAELSYGKGDEPNNSYGIGEEPKNRPPELRFTRAECMLQGPFSLTWLDEAQNLRERFRQWFTECLVVALRTWADTL